MKITRSVQTVALLVFYLSLINCNPALAANEPWKIAFVQGDYASAYRLSRPAAQQGDVHAAVLQCTLFENGFGVAQDYSEAAYWCRSAAEQGDPQAEDMLGSMYALGEGMQKDYLQAHKWWNLASSHYSTTDEQSREAAAAAAKRRDQAARLLTADQLKQALQLAAEWTAGCQGKGCIKP